MHFIIFTYNSSCICSQIPTYPDLVFFFFVSVLSLACITQPFLRVEPAWECSYLPGVMFWTTLTLPFPEAIKWQWILSYWWNFAHLSSPCWDSIWLEFVKILYMAWLSLWFHMCRWSVCPERPFQSITASSSYSMPLLSSRKFSEPWGGVMPTATIRL